MSIQTFSEAFIKQFGTIVYPRLQANYTHYDAFFKLHDTDGGRTDVSVWMKNGIATDLPELSLLCNQQGWIVHKDFPADDVMRSILIWVEQHVTYTTDTVAHKENDYWQTPKETLLLRTGDCEDGAVLIASLAYVAGVEPSRYWVQWGQVIGGGHCYLCYLRDSDAEEVVLDWCYWFTPLVIKLRQWLGSDTKYGTIWGTAVLTGSVK